MTMHAARIANSPRLQRVLALLKTGGEFSTKDISDRAHVCAVNSAISEIRVAGYDIPCRVKTISLVAPFGDGEVIEKKRVWLYKLANNRELLRTLDRAACI